MKKCLKCNKEHDGSFASGRFCSISCANSRTWSKKAIEKKRISNSLAWTKFSRKEKERILGIARAGRKRKYHETMIESSTEDLKHGLRKKKVLLEQNGKCLHCGIEKWLDKPITLELDHIDGNKHNNIRKNLRVLCPNCHAQTETWRGRNGKGYALQA